jgi:WD40 repeat protein
VAFSPDDDHILTASVDNTARLWSIGGGNTVRVFADHTDDIWEAAYAPDGRSILTGSFDNTARIWNADFEHDNRIIHGHDGRISTVAFSPDGRFILSSSYDSTIRLWDAQTLDLGHLDVPTQLNNPFFVFSAQGRWLVATGGTWSDYGGTSTVIVWEKKGEEYKPEKILEQNVFMQVLGFSHPVDGTESEFLYLGRGEPDRILLQAGGSWDTTLRTYNNWWWNNDVALT